LGLAGWWWQLGAADCVESAIIITGAPKLAVVSPQTNASRTSTVTMELGLLMMTLDKCYTAAQRVTNCWCQLFFLSI
jgi:hypothetical protein